MITKIVKGSIYLFIGSLIARAIAYMTRIYMTKNMTTSEIGLFYSLFAVISFLITFRMMGITTALTKYISEFNARDDMQSIKNMIQASFRFQMLSALFLFIVVWFASPYLAIHYFKVESAKWLLRVLSLYFFTEIFYKNTSSMLLGFGKSKLLAWMEPLKNIFMFAILFVLFEFHYGIWSPIITYVIVSILVFIIIYKVLNKTLNLNKYKATNIVKTFKFMIKFGTPLTIASVGELFVSYFDTMILVLLSTLDQVGIYNIILPSAMMFAFVGNSVAVFLMPVVSKLYSENHIEEIKKGMRNIYKYSMLLLLPFFAVLFVFAYEFINIIYSPDYLKGIDAFRVLLIAVIMYTLYNLTNQCLIGIGKSKDIAKITWISGISNVVLNVIFIKMYGINGAAFAVLVSYGLSLGVSFYYLEKYLHIGFPFKMWFKTFLCSLAMVIFSMGVYFVLTKQLLQIVIFSNVIVRMSISLILGFLLYAEITRWVKLWNMDELKRFANGVLA